MRFLLKILLVCLPILAYTQNKPVRVLVSGFDSTNFYSNVFFIDELAYFNYTDTSRVKQVYRSAVLSGVRQASNQLVQFQIARDTVMKKLWEEAVYLVVKQPEDTFIGISGDAGLAELVQQELERTNCDYYLSINAFEIYSSDPPSKPEYYTPTQHILHYDLFDQDLKVVSNGKFAIPSYQVESFMMRSKYKSFGEKMAIETFNHSGATDMSPEEIEVYFEEYQIYNSVGIGLTLGWGGYTGIAGLYGSYLLNPNLELNSGIGIDFSGSVIQAGTKTYLRSWGAATRPFLGLNYAYHTGNTFILGSEYDEFGNPTPNNISEYQIAQGHTLNLSAGIRIVNENTTYHFSFGYGARLTATSYELIDGRFLQERDDFARSLLPGGFQFYLGVIGHLKKNGKK